MPSLAEMLSVVSECVPEADLEALARALRQRWPGERVYLPPPDSRKDPARAERIRELSRTLPTGVVAQRLGCSIHAVYRAGRKGK